MVKKVANITKISKFLTNSLQEEDIDLSLNLGEFIDILVQNDLCSGAAIINADKSRVFQGSSNEVDLNNSKLESFAVDDWGTLLIQGSKAQSKEFWENICDNLSLYIHSAELKEKTHLISAVTSDIRRTLRPDLALEKIYNSFKEVAGIEDFYFFTRIVSSDEEDEEIFKGYSLFFQNHDKTETSKILQHDELKKLSFIDKKNHAEIFSSKVRGREWGLMIVSRKAPWTDDLRQTFELFAEQMATVFNQHELHSESLTMAQREFLLNQITTKIRESLVVDKIIDTAVQEIAQVMGVESCGLVILNRRIRGTLGHRVWSVDQEYDNKMVEALYTALKSDLEPNWLQPSKGLADLSLAEDKNVRRLADDGIKSFLICGMFQDNSRELVGVLAVSFFNQSRNWTNDEQLLLEGVAKQLEIALMQASIYQEAQQTRRQMALLHKLSSDIRDSLDISKVLGQIAKGIGEVLGLSRCFVRRFSNENKILKTEQEFCGPNLEPTSDLIFAFEREWINNLATQSNLDKSMEILNIPSIEEKFKEESPDLLKISEVIELKSYLAIPLVARGRVLGTINVHQCDRERNFLPEEIEFILRVGSEAAIALEHAALFETINRFNKTDPDTGLYNKRYFREIAEKEIAKAKEEGKEISFMLVDVDHLKDINDDQEHGGHEAGDEAIQILAQVLSKTVRQTPVDEIHRRVADVVGRFGGDEFMILLPNTHINDAIIVANRIEANLKKAEHSSWPKPLTCSIGIAGTPHDDYDYESFKTQADKALYLSKDKGRNAISSTLEL